MRDAILSLAVIGGLLAWTIVVGRAIILILRIGYLARWTAENVIAAAFLGTGGVILPFGYCSYLGISAFSAALVVLALGLVLGISRLLFGLQITGPSRGQINLLLIVGLPITLGVGLCLLPLFLGDCYTFHNDTYIYDSVAEWLQDNGMGHSYSHDPSRPQWIFVLMLQGIGHRMGPMFLLALVESLYPDGLAIHVFEAVTAWGVALNLGGIYVLSRWTFRCSRLVGFFAMLIGCGLNPLWISSANGFLCQVYGTAVLAFALALLTRSIPETRWTLGTAVALATSAALLSSVYNEFMPILAGATIAWIVICWRRSVRKAIGWRLTTFVGIALVCFFVIANIEIFRAVKAILIMTKINGVGAHCDWSGLQYWAFAMGAKRFSTFTDMPLSFFPLCLVFLASSLFFLGLLRGIRSWRAWPALTSLFLFAALVAYFRWWAPDPWTGAIGHTWNLFKLCNWAFVLVLVIQAGGIKTLSQRSTLASHWILPSLCLVFFITNCWRIFREAKLTVAHYHTFYETKHPLASFRSVRKAIAEINPSSIYFFSTDNDPLHNNIVPYLLSPRPFCNPWPKDTFPFDPPAIAAPIPNSVIGLMYGDPPFELSERPLGFGLSLIDLQHTFIAHIGKDTAVLSQSNGQKEVAITAKETLVELWSPQAGNAVFAFDSQLANGPFVDKTFRLHVTVEGPTKQEFTLDGTGSAMVPIHAQAGVTRLHIFCTDRFDFVGPQREFPILAYLSHCQFSPSPPTLSVTRSDRPK